MGKKVCNWNEATDSITFEDINTANEYVRGKMFEFNIKNMETWPYFE